MNWRPLARRGWRLCVRRELQALVLAATCMLMYFGAIMPERQRLEGALRHPAAVKPERFHAPFSSQETFPDALDKLLKTAASHSLGVNEGGYTVTRETAGKLVRLQIVLPLRGDYPQVRSFLAALAHEVPGIALENVQFERGNVSDQSLEVKLRLVLFMAPAETNRQHAPLDVARNVFAATSWQAAAAPQPAPVPVIVAPPAPLSAPPLPFRFLGRYGDGDSQLVMLVKGEKLYLVSVGDTIDDAWRVDRVSGTVVELTYLPLQLKQSLITGDAG